jgi:DNA uptake protein ComE-like DNA-binding protein
MPDWLKDLFGFYRSESKGVLFMLTCLGILLLVKTLEPFSWFGSSYAKADFDSLLVVEEENFRRHLHHVVPFDTTFDPNLLDSLQWNAIGLSPRQSALIVRIAERRKFRMQQADFKSLAFIDTFFWERYMPFMHFPPPKTYPVSTRPDNASKNWPIREIPKELVLDPNTASAEELELLGLNSGQVRNVLNFRNSSGRFNRLEDLLRLYTIDRKNIERIKPHLTFPKTIPQKNFTDSGQFTEWKERRNWRSPLELNRCDTVDLINLPMIGPFYAMQILKYRELLGGFYSPGQLYEIKNIPGEVLDSVIQRFTADSSMIKTIPINAATYKQLIAHPYFDNYHVKEVLKLREQKGKFITLSALDNIPFADLRRLEKIKHYLHIDE